MLRKYLSIFILGILILLPLMAYAASNVVTLANIISGLNHYPSENDKQQLQKIINDSASTENEKIIAAAIKSMDHQVNSTDKQKLNEVLASTKASEAEKTIAKILIDISHKPSAQDKKSLAGITE